MAGKEGIFAILDVGKSMKKKYLNTEETRLSFGIESIRQLIQQKLIFNNKRDQIGIILMGREGEEAENINIYSELDFPSINLLNQLNGIEAEDEEDNGDIFLTLDFAIDEFIAKYKKLKWGKKIFLITDGESKCKMSQQQIEELAERINDNDVKVNIICVGFFEELDDEEEDEEEKDKKKINDESDNQKETKELLKVLQSNTENVKLFTATTANDIYHQFKKRKINPTTKFRGPFIITPNLSLDVMAYSKTSPQSIPSLKKYSKAVEFSDEPGKCEISTERIY
jgi:ATP-dependent DNA helicase 2 subunit 2